MATKVLSNEFMQNIATEEAWKDLRLCRREYAHRRHHRGFQRQVELAQPLK